MVKNENLVKDYEEKVQIVVDLNQYKQKLEEDIEKLKKDNNDLLEKNTTEEFQKKYLEIEENHKNLITKKDEIFNEYSKLKSLLFEHEKTIKNNNSNLQNMKEN